jgi:non-homologous end joining protein Ku
MIEARAAGKELPRPKKAPARAKVVNLMDVLQQSLEESKKQRAASAPKRAAHRATPSSAGRRKKKSA